MGRVVVADALARCAVVLLTRLGGYRLQATVAIILEGKVCVLEVAVRAQPTIDRSTYLPLRRHCGLRKALGTRSRCQTLHPVAKRSVGVADRIDSRRSFTVRKEEDGRNRQAQDLASRLL